jgi:hypothetical protein
LTTAAVEADQTTLAGDPAAPQLTAAATGDDERRVTGTDHETATTATAATFERRHARAADGDLQGIPCGQTEIAADFSASTAVPMPGRAPFPPCAPKATI